MDDMKVNVVVESWFVELTTKLTGLVSDLSSKGIPASAAKDIVYSALQAALPHAIKTRLL